MGFRLYHLLFITAVLLILLSLFIAETNTLDLHLADTYLVLSGVLILRTLALFLLLLWLLYRFTQNFLFSHILSGLHIVVTLAAAVCVTFFLFYYAAYARKDIVTRGTSLRLILPLFIISTLLSQLLYIINLLLGVIRRFN